MLVNLWSYVDMAPGLKRVCLMKQQTHVLSTYGLRPSEVLRFHCGLTRDSKQRLSDSDSQPNTSSIEMMERKAIRGRHCSSIDALILHQRKIEVKRFTLELLGDC